MDLESIAVIAGILLFFSAVATLFKKEIPLFWLTSALLSATLTFVSIAIDRHVGWTLVYTFLTIGNTLFFFDTIRRSDEPATS